MQKIIIYNQKKLSYTIHGGGKHTLMLIHGFCENKDIWKRQVAMLSKTYKLICPDLPGFGDSDTANPISMEDMADGIKYILDEEVIGKVTMIGHSMGGYVTLAFAQKYIDRLNGIGLFHSTASEDLPERKENRTRSAEFIKENGTIPFTKTLVPKLFAPDYSDENIISEVAQMANSCSAEGLIAGTLAMRDRKNYENLLTKLNIPVLFCIGKKDSIIPAENLYTQSNLPQKSMVCAFPLSGHMGMLEEIDLANNTIDKFVSFCN
jgi:pimeloyl-ACP methyl ester carboxylesterase